MRTDRTKVFGSVTLRAVVSFGALMELHDRFGTLTTMNQRNADLDLRFISPALTTLVVAGGVEASKAHNAVAQAIEEAGLLAVANWLSATLKDAVDKADAAAGEDPGTENAAPSTPD